MSLLLDTNVILWAALGDPRLGRKSLRLLSDPREAVFVSAVSSCEIAIKWSKGKIELPQGPGAFLSKLIANAGYSQLTFTVEHAAGLGTLPWHHRDPWDRLLIAQAQAMELRIITGDRMFQKYDVEIFLV